MADSHMQGRGDLLTCCGCSHENISSLWVLKGSDIKWLSKWWKLIFYLTFTDIAFRWLQASDLPVVKQNIWNKSPWILRAYEALI